MGKLSRHLKMLDIYSGLQLRKS